VKEFIRHLWNEHQEEIVSRSLLNCHLENLHSVMLLDQPEKRIRLFVADEGNDLYRNWPEAALADPLSIAFHPHHCNVSLHVLNGVLTNWVVERNAAGLFDVSRFLYESGITGSGIGFRRDGEDRLQTASVQTMFPGQSIFMWAHQIHTVHTYKHQPTAWLVYEGKEDPDYMPHSWSNADLERADFSKLYQKPTRNDVQELLRMAKL